MNKNLLLYYISVGLISGFATSDCSAMNMKSLPPILPLSAPVVKHIMPIQPISANKEVPNLTPEERLCQSVRQMMEKGSTELVIDKYYDLLKDAETISCGSLKCITCDANVINYIRNNVTTLIINKGCGNINIALQDQLTKRKQALFFKQNHLKSIMDDVRSAGLNCYDAIESEYNKILKECQDDDGVIWFSALKHIIVDSDAKFNLFDKCNKTCDILVKAPNYKVFSDIKKNNPSYKCSWIPTFGAYKKEDNTLMLTSIDQVNYLNDIGNDVIFNQIIFPKGANVDLSILRCCNEIVIDYSSSLFSFGCSNFDSNKKIIIRCTEDITAHLQNLKMLEVENAIKGIGNSDQEDCLFESYGNPSEYIESLKGHNIELVWQNTSFLKSPDFTLNDSMNIARKVRIGWDTVIHTPFNTKWIGKDAFSSKFEFPNMFLFNVTIPNNVIDIDYGALSNKYIQDVIVESDRLKKLVKYSGFVGDIIVDTELGKRSRTSRAKGNKFEIENKLFGIQSKLTATENELADTQTKLTTTESKLLNTEKQLADTQTKLAMTESKLLNTEKQLADMQNKLMSLEEKFADMEMMFARCGNCEQNIILDEENWTILKKQKNN